MKKIFFFTVLICCINALFAQSFIYNRNGGKVFLIVDTMHTVLAIDYYATQETIELINKKIDSISAFGAICCPVDLSRPCA